MFAECDLVLEAVFEELGVKREVLAELERVVPPTCVLATNTSSLSVTAMAEGLAHPERVVGLHFFNPVAVLPLVELVRTPATDDVTLATAWEAVAEAAQARSPRRRRARVRRQPGADADDDRAGRRAGAGQHRRGDRRGGAEARAAAGAVGAAPDGRPARGEPRAPDAARRVPRPLSALGDAGQLRGRARRDRRPGAGATPGRRDPRGVLEALADEIGRILDDGVVGAAADVDSCLLLGAGWPFWLGGITPHLDATGVSERVNGRPFHAQV